MDFNVDINSLGKLQEGSLGIKPLTILTGTNGTGKSFVTKVIYSILNVINKNVYHLRINRDLNSLSLHLKSFIGNIYNIDKNDFENIKDIENSLIELINEFNLASTWKVQEYLDFTQSQERTINKILKRFNNYIVGIQNEDKIKSIKSQIETIKFSFEELRSKLTDSRDSYITILLESIQNEIKDNFQISRLSDLITFGNEDCNIALSNLCTIIFSQDGKVKFEISPDFIDQVSSLSRVVFFESPAYWKVKDALLSVKNMSSNLYLNEDSNNILNGVPKYFYDLDEALKIKSKSENKTELDEICGLLKNELGGEFVFEGDNIYFKDSSTGQKIPKNLISFGMTNIGMIHALLSRNVITSGSFVFIDEPETNLHPEWQSFLMGMLIKLAKQNINIVIATHSIEMLKSIEISFKENRDLDESKLLSVNYFDSDGTLLEFDSENPLLQLNEARDELSSAYSNLFIRGSICD